MAALASPQLQRAPTSAAAACAAPAQRYSPSVSGKKTLTSLKLRLPAPQHRTVGRAPVLAGAYGNDKGGSTSTTTTRRQEEVEEATKKWGLEAGLWRALRGSPGGTGEAAPSGANSSAAPPEAQQEEGGSSVARVGAASQEKSNTELAKELLAKYGGAYLATSITLALISFSFFYVLVDRGVDVASLLQQLGLDVDSTGERVGTVAIAYAAHKAASPIRFPPTVILTPIVANFFGNRQQQEEKQ